MKLTDASIFGFFLCAVSACNSTGVGNPPGATSLSLSLTNDPEVEPEPDSTDSTAQLDAAALQHAILVFGELRFLACSGNASDAIVSNRIVVDLVQNVTKPEIPDVPIPSGGFCGIDATLTPATTPAEVAGRSMLFSGVRSDGTKFLLLVDMPGTLRLRPRANVLWPTDGEHGWLWALRPRRWLLPSELDSSDTETSDGAARFIVIDVNDHRVLYSLIRERIAGRSTLHVDMNDNHTLDPEERDSDAFIGEGLGDID
jgi:hypothetical protein